VYVLHGAVTFGMIMNVIQSGRALRSPGDRAQSLVRQLESDEKACCVSAYQRQTRLHCFRDMSEFRASLPYLEQCEGLSFYAVSEADAEAIRSWLKKWEKTPSMSNDAQFEFLQELLGKGRLLVCVSDPPDPFVGLERFGRDLNVWGLADGPGIREALLLIDQPVLDAQLKRARRRGGQTPMYMALPEGESIKLLARYDGAA